MALIDKVKAQATQLAQKAQEAGKAGQAKFEDVQARRRADALLRELGAAVYAQRLGRASGESAEIDRLITELTAYESEHGPLSATESDEHDEAPGKDPDNPPKGH